MEDQNIGWSLKLLVGHGFDENNLIVYEINSSYAVSEELNKTSVAQGVFSGSFYHYFGSKTSGNFFASAGIGTFAFGSRYSNIGGTGLGFKLGIGFEITSHWQLESSWLWGEATSNDDWETKHQLIMLLLSAHAF